MRSGICQVCHQQFRLTKHGKLYRHGFKWEVFYKGRYGLFTAFIKCRVITKSPCLGSGFTTVRFKK